MPGSQEQGTLGCWQNHFRAPQSRADRLCRAMWKEMCLGRWKEHLFSSSRNLLLGNQEIKSNGDDVGGSYSAELRFPIDLPVQKSSSVISPFCCVEGSHNAFSLLPSSAWTQWS